MGNICNCSLHRARLPKKIKRSRPGYERRIHVNVRALYWKYMKAPKAPKTRERGLTKRDAAELPVGDADGAWSLSVGLAVALRVTTRLLVSVGTLNVVFLAMLVETVPLLAVPNMLVVGGGVVVVSLSVVVVSEADVDAAVLAVSDVVSDAVWLEGLALPEPPEMGNWLV